MIKVLKIAAKITRILITLGLATSFAVMPSTALKRDSGGLGKDILIAANASLPEQKSTVLRDTRIFLSEIFSNDKITPAKAAFIRKAAEATVHVSAATLKGVKLNPFEGTGWVFEHSKDSTYIVTNRHNVNRGQFALDDNGNKMPKLDVKANPVGSRVEIKYFPARSVAPVMITGTVAFADEFESGVIGDTALIRLDQRIDVEIPDLARLSDEDLVGKSMMSGGFPSLMKPSSGGRELVIEPSCYGVRETSGGFLTTCLGSSGGSGGWVAANVSLDPRVEKWAFVGISTKVDGSDPAGSTQKTGLSGATKMISLRKVTSNLRRAVENDVMAPQRAL